MRRSAVLLMGIGLVVGCGPTMPPKELADARTEYTVVANGPAATEAPAHLHSAKTALDDAERAFADGKDDRVIRAKSYVAVRRAQLAESAARVEMSQKAKVNADVEAQRLQNETLKHAQTELESSQESLAKTQDQLEHEKNARAEAEKKQAQAMADLEKVAKVKQEQRGTVITLSGSVLFASNESRLLPSAIMKVNEVADALLKGDPDSTITIEGHTDSQGSREHNMLLAQRRAEAVKAQLVSRGVASDRIRAVGVGPDRPVADNKSVEGRANNRRVEVVVGNGHRAR